MAPIYDRGESYFAGKRIPADDRELFNVEVSSFAAKELKLLKYVQNPLSVNVSKFPSSEYIRKMYCKDSQADINRIDHIIGMYEHKLDLPDQFQLRKNIGMWHKTN